MSTLHRLPILPIPQRVAQLYDAAVPDWPGEIDFYREFAAEAASKGGAVLEVACGTGRVAIRLAQDGVRVVGIDLSTAMLDVAWEKSAGDLSGRAHGAAGGAGRPPGEAYYWAACATSVSRVKTTLAIASRQAYNLA